MNGADPDWTKADVLDTVFQTWQEVMKHPTAKLTRERERLILARLRDGYAPFQMVKAVRGCAKSAYHMGENENGTVYDSLGLILRNGEKVEQFMGYADVKKKRSANSFPGQGGRS